MRKTKKTTEVHISLTPEMVEIWEKLREFDLDEGHASGLSQRLAKEQAWSSDFVRDAILEYKAFVMLCLISPKEVTPSETVDKVWHTHLLYTESYWNKMCDEILGSKLHHRPSKGDEKEASRFDDQYRYTLALYGVIFDNTPNKSIWPPVKKPQFKLRLRKKSDNENRGKITTESGFIPLLLVADTNCSQLSGAADSNPAIDAGNSHVDSSDGGSSSPTSDGGSSAASCGGGSSCGGGGGCGGGC